MTAKKWAISKASEKIALSYGDNVSRGIVEMESVISDLRDKVKRGGTLRDDC